MAVRELIWPLTHKIIRLDVKYDICLSSHRIYFEVACEWNTTKLLNFLLCVNREMLGILVLLVIKE